MDFRCRSQLVKQESPNRGENSIAVSDYISRWRESNPRPSDYKSTLRQTSNLQGIHIDNGHSFFYNFNNQPPYQKVNPTTYLYKQDPATLSIPTTSPLPISQNWRGLKNLSIHLLLVERGASDGAGVPHRN